MYLGGQQSQHHRRRYSGANPLKITTIGIFGVYSDHSGTTIPKKMAEPFVNLKGQLRELHFSALPGWGNLLNAHAGR